MKQIQGKQGLVRDFGRFGKPRVREIGIPLYTETEFRQVRVSIRETVMVRLRPIPNVVLLPCRTQINLTRQWHDYTTTVVSNVKFNSVAPNGK